MSWYPRTHNIFNTQIALNFATEYLSPPWSGLPGCQLLPNSWRKPTGILHWEARQILHWNAGRNLVENVLVNGFEKVARYYIRMLVDALAFDELFWFIATKHISQNKIRLNDRMRLSTTTSWMEPCISARLWASAMPWEAAGRKCQQTNFKRWR